MISFMIFFGRPVRSASSACDIPLSSRTSRSVSPGWETSSGMYSLTICLAMVVLYRQEPDGSHFLKIQSAVPEVRQWVVGRLEYQPVGWSK